MKYKLIVFDFDGTLADSFHWFTRTINQLAELYHFKQVTPDECERLRVTDARAVLKHLQVPFWKVPRIGAHVRSLMNREIQHIPPFAGIGQVLPRLAQQGATLGLVSSNSFENIQLVLGGENAGLFAYRECGVSVFGKAVQLRKILCKSLVDPADAIYIGDEIRDAEAARAVRMRFGAVAWGYTQLDALKTQAPDETFLQVAELSERLA